MKKLLTIALLSIIYNANAINYTIVNQSFDTVTGIQLGSHQYLDVNIYGTFNETDSIKIFIYHKNSNGTFGSFTKIFSKHYSTYFDSLPQNANGSYRIFFYMPMSYQLGTFKIMLLNAVTYPLGFFTTTTAINDFLLLESNKSAIYYNLNGQVVMPNKTGMYIEVCGKRTRKIYIIK